ncbi:MAG: aminoglycoside phosphotransferase family protein [Proteobacteria bacterium]|nr:aminoglycoside phosphotransferase family protein [Pseudomonadota bacterium]
MADGQKTTQYSFQHIASLLKKDGLLIHIGISNKPLRNDWFRRIGYHNSQYYAALPASAPRIFFPLYPKRFRQKCFSFHSPGSRKARLGLKLLEVMSRFGLIALLRQHGVIVAGQEELKDRKDTLCSWLGEVLSQKIENVAIYCGSDLARRKITLLAEAQNQGRVTVLVVKIADTSEGAAAIRQESEALQALEGARLFCEVPRLLLEDTWEGHAVQVQSALPLSTGPQIPELTVNHLKLLAALSRMHRQKILFRETPAWKTIEMAWKANEFEKWPSPSQNLLDNLLSEETGNVQLVCHHIHGDFAPWNIRVKKDKLYVFDWEESIPNGLPFSDAFHFIYRQASLVGPWPGGEVMWELLEKKFSQLAEMAEYPSMYENILPALMILEYLKRPHPHLIELMSVLLSKPNVQTS